MSDAGDINLGSESMKGLVGKIVQALIGFAGTIIFARQLGPTSFGGFYFLLTLVALSDRPVRGLSTAARKRYSEAEADYEEIVGSVILVLIMATAFATAVVFALRKPLIQTTNVAGAPTVFVALFVSILLFVFFQSLVGASGLISTQIWLDTVRSILTFPLQLFFVFVGFSAAGMGYGLAVASLISFALAAYIVRIKPSVPSTETLQSLWKYARYSIPGTFVGKAYGQFDILLIGFVLTTYEAGLYKVAFQLTIPATFIYSVICAGLMPKVSNLSSRGEAVSVHIANALSFASVLSIPIFFGALAIPESILVTIYGGEYASARTLLIGLALHRIIVSQSEIYNSTLHGLDSPDLVLRIDTFALIVNFGLGLVLIYEFGAIGVVVATVFAEAVRLVLSARSVLQQLPDIQLIPNPLVDQLIAGVTMFLAAELFGSMVTVQSWMDLMIIVCSSAVVYGATLLLRSRFHRQTVVSILRDITPT